MKKLSTKQMVNLGLLIALNVIFSRYFSFMLTESIKFGTSFIVMAVIGTIYGPIWGGVAGVISDLIGVMLNPQGSGFFFGFTISAFVNGVIYGYFLNKKPYKSYYVVITVIASSIIVSFLLNTYWLVLMSGNEKSFSVLFYPRFMTQLVIIPFRIIILIPFMKLFHTQLSKYISE